MPHLRLRALYAIFFVSGFCGLIYESIWSHYLKLLLGHAAYAQAVVLVVFVGGMAIGAWLTGRFSERIRHPILAYAMVELLVAVVAFVFHRVFLEASGWAQGWLLPTVCGSGGACWANWLLAAMLILPPSILLGTTFPLMSAGVLRLGVGAGRGLSLLYFLNSAGAALGVLGSGFFLIPALGLPGTMLLAGSMNVLVAFTAWLAMSWGGLKAATPLRTEHRPESGTAARWLLVTAALTGLSSFIYEVVWIRMLTQVLGAATHSFELMLSSFILGLALGGLWVRNRIDRMEQPERLLAWVQIAMGLAAVATLPLYFWSFDAMALTLRALARNEAAYFFFTLASAAMTMAVMLPAAFCAGMTLPLITAVLIRRGGGERQIGRVYGVNTLGAILGVLVTVHLLMPLMGLKYVLAVGAVIDVLLGALILGVFRDGAPRWRWRLGAAAAALVAAVAVPAAVPITAVKTASGVFRNGMANIGSDREVLYNRDGRTSTITVLKRPDGLLSLATNGKNDGSSYPDMKKTSGDDNTVVLLGALGPLHHPSAKSAAVIGLGTGLTTAVLLQSENLRSVETIEIEPRMVEAAQFFRPANAPAFDDPRSSIVIDDARAHFARTPKRYDIIVSEPSNPWVSGVSGLFTQEFYERAAGQLAPGGHFVQWLQLYEASPMMVGSIVRAFSAVFPEFTVFASNGVDIILVARADGKAPRLDPAAFGMKGLRDALLRIAIDSEPMLAAHEIVRGGPFKLMFGSYGAPPNSDFFPYVDSRAAVDRFTSASASGIQRIHLAPLPLLGIGSGSASYLGQVTRASDEMPPKIRDLASAYHGARFLRGEMLTGAERGYMGGLLRDYELVRLWLFACQPTRAPASLWDAAINVAIEINTGLPPAQAGAIWRSVLDGPCRGRLLPAQAEWIQLFAMAGARDAAGVKTAADRVLAQPGNLTPQQHEYATYAATSSRLALGEHASARKIFETEGKRISSSRADLPWFRYLTLVLAARQKDLGTEVAALPDNPSSGPKP